jgi:hypothetical protein
MEPMTSDEATSARMPGVNPSGPRASVPLSGELALKNRAMSLAPSIRDASSATVLYS